MTHPVLPSDDKLKVALQKAETKLGGEILGYSREQLAHQMKVSKLLLTEIGCGEIYKPGFDEKLRASLLDVTENVITSFKKNHDTKGLDPQEWALLTLRHWCIDAHPLKMQLMIQKSDQRWRGRWQQLH